MNFRLTDLSGNIKLGSFVQDVGAYPGNVHIVKENELNMLLSCIKASELLL